MGKSTISTGPFSISQTVTVNYQSKFMVFSKTGSSWRLPWGSQSPFFFEAESDESSWLALAAFTSFSILEPQLTMGPWHQKGNVNVASNTICGHEKLPWNPRKSLTTRPSKNGQNRCLFGSFPTNPIKLLGSGDVFFRLDSSDLRRSWVLPSVT